MPGPLAAIDGLLERRPRLAAFGAGALSTLAMPPVLLWPVLVVTLGVLVRLIDRAVLDGAGHPLSITRALLGRAALLGWLFGFGYFVLGLYWMSASLLVEPEKFLWLLPFSATLIPAGLAGFWGAATALAALMWRPGIARVLALALAFGLAEWLRGHLFTGLPWNALGYALTAPLALAQWASLLGVYGLSLLAVLLLAMPVAALGRAAERERLAYILAPCAVLAGAMLIGSLRLAGPSAPAVPGVTLRILQPNVPQNEKWRHDHRERIFLDYLAQSRRDASGRVDDLAGSTHLVWPESAIPFLLLHSPPALAAVAELLPPGKLLVTGAIRLEEPLPGNGAAARRRVYNSILALDDEGRLAAFYDKLHLVPFGEYLPFQRWLEAIGLEQLTRVRGGFDAGRDASRSLAVPGLPPASPLVCYEAIFPDGVTARGGARPSLLLNVTNDGWFGSTAGPHQHFHQARVRAIEQGLPLVRAANTGISAVVDGHGRVLARLPLGRQGVIDSPLPQALRPTLYSRFGDAGLLAMLLAGLGWWYALTRTRGPSSRAA